MMPALETGGVTVPDTLTLEGGRGLLVLNGSGVRRKLGFKVYVAGLYTRAKTTDSRKIIQADEPMAISMFWKRGVSAQKISKVFSEGFEYAAGGDHEQLKGSIDTFLRSVAEARKTDIWRYVYLPDQGVSVYCNDHLKTRIPGLAFKKALFGIWLLEEDAFDGDKGLRAELLGK